MADFQNFFADTYLLFVNMQVKSLKSQAKIDFFEIEYGIFRLKNSGKNQNFVFFNENKKYNKI